MGQSQSYPDGNQIIRLDDCSNSNFQNDVDTLNAQLRSLHQVPRLDPETVNLADPSWREFPFALPTSLRRSIHSAALLNKYKVWAATHATVTVRQQAAVEGRIEAAAQLSQSVLQGCHRSQINPTDQKRLAQVSGLLKEVQLLRNTVARSHARLGKLQESHPAALMRQQNITAA
ncbi:hypothetical protein WJX72_011409 [[Myrmecia] bisecta]|uniref:Uncharacterized protein n=1 Tax=[Myrmecia] bisecta TaxID=41462 RepID=A0AAW1PF76_9CHLO